jgi:hypothetical protein
MNELADILSVKNIFDDVTSWAEISQEQVLERNPQYIVTVGMYFGEGLTPSEEILSREAWQGISAIKNGKVYNVDSDSVSRPGPRLADAVLELYDFFYLEDIQREAAASDGAPTPDNNDGDVIVIPGSEDDDGAVDYQIDPEIPLNDAE